MALCHCNTWCSYQFISKCDNERNRETHTREGTWPGNPRLYETSQPHPLRSHQWVLVIMKWRLTTSFLLQFCTLGCGCGSIWVSIISGTLLVLWMAGIVTQALSWVDSIRVNRRTTGLWCLNSAITSYQHDVTHCHGHTPMTKTLPSWLWWSQNITNTWLSSH